MSAANNKISQEELQLRDKTLFGFWVYIMTDCLLFASLFAAYAALRNNTAFGPNSEELFSLSYVLVETLLLLTSSFTSGVGLFYAHKKNKQLTLFWLIATAILGAIFVQMELIEFIKLYSEGNGPQTSAFLSSYFTLVGTHGLHISVGLLWLGVMIFSIIKRGFVESTTRRLMMFGLFWHFLDIVWIFIFSIVYLFGVGA